mmetsp:Transcript_104128/g.261060  ORF Transcript_104128/g.261060 Transcript_104128/m.261060 type:complete len:253 (+) Transcript_104128:64-822(+)
MPPNSSGAEALPDTIEGTISSRRACAVRRDSVRSSTSCSKEAFLRATARMRPEITAVACLAPPESLTFFNMVTIWASMARSCSSLSFKSRNTAYIKASSESSPGSSAASFEPLLPASAPPCPSPPAASTAGGVAGGVATGSGVAEGTAGGDGTASSLPHLRSSKRPSIFLPDWRRAGVGVPSSRDFEEYSGPVGEVGSQKVSSSPKETRFAIVDLLGFGAAQSLEHGQVLNIRSVVLRRPSPAPLLALPAPG